MSPKNFTMIDKPNQCDEPEDSRCNIRPRPSNLSNKKVQACFGVKKRKKNKKRSLPSQVSDFSPNTSNKKIKITNKSKIRSAGDNLNTSFNLYQHNTKVNSVAESSRINNCRPTSNGISHNEKLNNGSSSIRNNIFIQRKNLPIFSSKNVIVSELQKHNTTIVIGETGSGKTTQLPQFLHEKRLDKEGSICVTQPRRVAAITIAKRVAEEMYCEVGDIVGYSVRFEDCTSFKTKVKYVTDGMLLREALTDPLLTNYKWIILDEAHERSINTDILFGIVKEAQKLRKKKLPLHIVVMSATMNIGKFSSYFNNAPILYIEGRQHPIEVNATKTHHADYMIACVTTMVKIHKEANSEEDILIFLTGQEEIDFAVKLINFIAKKSELSGYPRLKAFPLYAALPYNLQLKVFNPSLPGERKVIVSTNIAETSVTIPGIKYVIDSGYSKVRTYNSVSGFDDLKVCRISQAQAMQRMGRAGREGPGVCYRAYTNEEFESMKENTIPEIVRANLASVLLKLLAVGVKDIHNFDFLDKPSLQHLVKAQSDLKDLKAIEVVNKLPVLTDVGKKLSIFPLEPQYAKLLLNGSKYSCTDEMLTIISILSSESIFVNPSDKREIAAEMREKFKAVEGDHITYLNIYKAFNNSINKKKWCAKNFLNFRNLSYASNVRQQLEELCQKNKIPVSSCNNQVEPVLRCIISCMYKNIGRSQPRMKFKILHSREEAQIHPSSGLHGRTPEFIIFTNLVKTQKTFMHIVSEVKVNWLIEEHPEHFKHINAKNL